MTQEQQEIFLREHRAHTTGVGSFVFTGPMGVPHEAPEPVKAPVTTNPDDGSGSRA
jgi:hypothetical protein